MREPAANPRCVIELITALVTASGVGTAGLSRAGASAPRPRARNWAKSRASQALRRSRAAEAGEGPCSVLNMTASKRASARKAPSAPAVTASISAVHASAHGTTVDFLISHVEVGPPSEVTSAGPR